MTARVGDGADREVESDEVGKAAASGGLVAEAVIESVRRGRSRGDGERRFGRAGEQVAGCGCDRHRWPSEDVGSAARDAGDLAGEPGDLRQVGAWVEPA